MPVACPLTQRQLEYLAFVRDYTRLHGQAPAEMEIAQHFGVAPPSAHMMLVKLERLGAIARSPRTARSIRVLIPETGPHHVDRLLARSSARVEEQGEVAGEPAVAVGRAIVKELFFEGSKLELHEEELVPLLGAVARGTAQALVAAGKTAHAGEAARQDVLRFAAASYARVCAMNNPEEADEEADTERFWEMLDLD